VEQRYGDTDTLTEPDVSSATQRYEEARAAAARAMTTVTVVPDKPAPGQLPLPASIDEPYRGFKLGATLFGWLIMMSMGLLIAAAVAGAAIGSYTVLDYTRADLNRHAGTAAITAAAVLVLVVCLAFYSGGYVAGRLARFDGARQGFGVWMFSFVLVALVAGLGAYANSLYNLVDRVDRPDVPLTNDNLLTGGLITAAALLMLPLLAALLGGKTGQRYHDKIDDLID
jgi:hypothetical protein